MKPSPHEETVSISQAAKLSGLSIKTVRYYDTTGLVSGTRLASGYRRYSPDDVAKLSLIARLRQYRYPLETIRQVVTDTITVSQSIERQLDVVSQQLQHLKAVQETLIYALKSLPNHSNTPAWQTLQQVTAVAEQNYAREIQERFAQYLSGISRTDSEQIPPAFLAVSPMIPPTLQDTAQQLWQFLREVIMRLKITPPVLSLPVADLEKWAKLWSRVDTLMDASVLPQDRLWQEILDDFVDQGAALYNLRPDVFRQRWIEVSDYLDEHPEWINMTHQLFPAWTRQLKRYQLLLEALRENTRPHDNLRDRAFHKHNSSLSMRDHP